MRACVVPRHRDRGRERARRRPERCTPEGSVSVNVPAQVDAPLPEATVTELQNAVTAAMTATGSTGAIVGVWAPWSGTWVSGMGTQGPGGAEVTADLGFRAGDVTGAMTCDVLYRLAADGKASIAERSRHQLGQQPPRVRGHHAPSTLRRHLGLASYTSVLDGQVAKNPERVWNPRELMTYGIASPRTHAPGVAFSTRRPTTCSPVSAERIANEPLSSSSPSASPSPWASRDRTPRPRPADPAAVSLSGYWSQQNAEGAWNCTDPATTPTCPRATAARRGGSRDEHHRSGAVRAGARHGCAPARRERPIRRPRARRRRSAHVVHRRGRRLPGGIAHRPYGSAPGTWSAPSPTRRRGCPSRSC